MKRIKRLLALMMAAVMVLSTLSGMTAKADSCGGLEAIDIYTPASDEAIQDPALHWAVRAAMNSINLNGQKLTKEMVGSTAVKDISFEQCAHPEDFIGKDEWKDKQFWIESLEGLQYATNARMIDIAYTSAVEGKKISDLSPIADLTQLEILILKQDGIDSIDDIGKLVNLTQLDLSSNKAITDVSAIADMSKLKTLVLSHNKVTSVEAISNLKELEYVALDYNEISSLPDLSKLTKVWFFDATENDLTNDDVKEIAKMKNLTKLTLSGNTKITDYKPLADLTKLTAENTVLPDETKEIDLFAAIEVNKLFEVFNISKMSPDDLADVEKALTAYENLTDEQKTYIDSNKVNAAQSNKDLVANGKDPVDYPEYSSGAKVPELKKIEISVVDKYGQPMKGVEFHKKQKEYGSVIQTFTTNEKGKLVITHTSMDNVYGEIIIVPKGDAYVAEPAEISYMVSLEKETKVINGKKATGLEELQMVLVPVNEYVDKSALKGALAATENVEREYKYTVSSYKTYTTALNTAQTCFDNPDATEQEVADATSTLNDAIEALEKNDVLTQLKIKVVDTNGNTFHRAFKFQIRVPGTGAEAWNDFTCPYSGTAYLKTSPGWTEGKEWEILACYEEPYVIESFRATIGVKDGQVYFKTVDGKPVDVDFEKEVVATYVPEEASTKRAPDKQIVKEAIDYANEKNLADYTTTTAAKLATAVHAAEAVLEKTDAIQEDYNEVIVDILEAREALVEAANKVWLEEEIDIAKTSYSAAYYTKASWAAFEKLLADAQDVFADGDATQKQVDDTVESLKMVAKNVLVRKADNTALKDKLAEAEAIKADDYTEESFQTLTNAIKAAQAVCDNDESTKETIAAQVEALEKAIEDLVEKEVPPVEADYTCQNGVFKAKVVDKDGNPVEGVKFDSYIDGTLEEEKTMISDKNGIIAYQVYGQNNKKVTYIKLTDDRYKTEDEHYFEASGDWDWTTFITSVDGQLFADGIKLMYTVTEATGTTPDPEPTDKVLSDANTFRAKVVDEDGNPMAGVEFNLVPPAHYGAPTRTAITNENGILEYTTVADDFYINYDVQVVGDVYTSTPEKVLITTGAEGVILTVDGNTIEEVEEIVFVLTAAGSETPDPEPEVSKEDLESKLAEAKAIEADKYTEESFTALEAAIEVAQAVCDKADATQKEVDEQVTALEAAIRGLIEDLSCKHDFNTNYTIDKMPTCTEGAVLNLHCTKCGEILEGSTIVTFKLPHTYKSVTIPATTSKDGKIEQVCTGCKCVKEGSTKVISRIDKVKLSSTNYTYNGKTRKPSVTVIDKAGKTISSKYYTVSYSSGLKKVGQYTVKVTFKGDYSGSKSETFVISPKDTKISKVSKAKKAFNVKWKKQSKEVTGYQIQYSTDKNFKKSVKTTTIKKYKTTSKKISKLKAKKKYYVRVRTYKTVKINGKSTKLYSGWSKVKSVKTK